MQKQRAKNLKNSQTLELSALFKGSKSNLTIDPSHIEIEDVDAPPKTSLLVQNSSGLKRASIRLGGKEDTFLSARSINSQPPKINTKVSVQSSDDLDESVQCKFEVKPADLAQHAFFEKFDYNSFDSADSNDFSDYEDFNDNAEHKQDLVTNVIKKPKQEIQWNCCNTQTVDPDKEGIATKIFNFFFK